MRRGSLCVSVGRAIRVVSVMLVLQATLVCPHCTRVPLVSVVETSTPLIPRPVTGLPESASSVYTILKDHSVALVLTSSLAMLPFAMIVDVSLVMFVVKELIMTSLFMPTACDCDPVGSLSLVCDKSSGECRCLKGVAGPDCSQCKVGACLFQSQWQSVTLYWDAPLMGSLATGI